MSSVSPKSARLSSFSPITVRSAPGVNRYFGHWHYVRLYILTGVVWAVTVPLFWMSGYAFWIVFEAIIRACHLPAGRSLLAPLFFALTGQDTILSLADRWSFDAAVITGLLAVWCVLYLGFDYLTLLGNLSAQKVLLEKARDAWGELPNDRFFVTLHLTRRIHGFSGDTGWLFFYPDRLEFLGDAYHLVLPRTALPQTVLLRHSFRYLTASYLYLSLGENVGVLQILPRNTATKLSETHRDGDDLKARLQQWFPDKAAQ